MSDLLLHNNLTLIVVKGFVSTEKTVNFVSAPVVASDARPVIPRAFAIPPSLPRSKAPR